MKGLLSLIFLLLGVTTSVSAWVLTWTNSDGKSYVEQQHSPVDCKKIEQAKGEKYRWSPEEDGLSIWLFENDKCEGFRAGYSPPSLWEKVSSRDLLSFRVALADDNENPTSTSTSTPTPTSTSTQTESATTTSSASPTATPSSEAQGGSVNSGAVAGGVVGGVAGVAAVCGLFFYLGRRKRSSKAEPEPRESGPDNGASTSRPNPPSPTGPPSAPPAAVAGYEHYDPSSYERKLELDSAPVYQAVSPTHHDEVDKNFYSPLDTSTSAHYPPARIISELPGDAGMVEMSDSHRLQELEANGTKMR